MTEKIIHYIYVKLNHADVSITMDNLREKFWVIQTRRAVRSVIIYKCKTCSRHSAKTVETSPTILPENRVRDANIFEITGIDFVGPLFLFEGQGIYLLFHMRCLPSNICRTRYHVISRKIFRSLLGDL